MAPVDELARHRIDVDPPSPAIPKVATADHYPGSVMIEGTTLSEGRGTALPFEIVGSPGIDPIELAHRLNMQHQRGVLFRPTAFRPTTGKHAGIDCRGCKRTSSSRACTIRCARG
ncbi:MAG: DUF1343 domain-containing protein [Chloroflexi bacterium]|nr:DUF1343 domain-containing protein [Chloroflexota bacterium]